MIPQKIFSKMVQIQCDRCHADNEHAMEINLEESICKECSLSNWVLEIGYNLLVYGDEDYKNRRDKIVIGLLKYHGMRISDPFIYHPNVFDKLLFDDIDRELFSLLFTVD